MRIAFRNFVRAAAAAGVLLAAACDSKSPPGGPGPTVVNPPQIACPVDVNVTGVSAPPQAVTYAPPTVTEGAQPVNTTCSPTSGSTFPLGTTPVSCAATDAMSRRATCSFNVTLKGMSLGAKRFLAVGDSFTEGENGRALQAPQFLDIPNAYPTKLQMALDASYPGQGIAVINRGLSGAPMSLIDQNVVKYVRAERPDVVLLEGGYNDLYNDCGTGPTNTALCRDAIRRVSGIFRDCIRHARENSTTVAYVFLATLTPPGPPPPQPGVSNRRISNDAIVQANAGIVQIAAAEGAVLVDVYPVFFGHEAEYIDTDGLHLRPAGYQAMADTFFAAIQKTVMQTPLFGFTAPR